MKRAVTHYVFVAALRVFVLLVWIFDGRYTGFGLVIVSLMVLELYYGSQNFRKANTFSDTPSAILTQLGYILGYYFLPSPGPNVAPLAIFYILALALDYWALLHLKHRFTFGGPTFCDWVTTGPYKHLSHPMWLARIMIYLGLLLSYNFYPPITLGFAFICNLLVWYIEIDFLKSVQPSNNA
jgi:hypothetical protein